MFDFKNNSTPETSEKYLGIMQTVWSSADSFIKDYYNPPEMEEKGSQTACFIAMTNAVKKLGQ